MTAFLDLLIRSQPPKQSKKYPITSPGPLSVPELSAFYLDSLKRTYRKESELELEDLKIPGESFCLDLFNEDGRGGEESGLTDLECSWDGKFHSESSLMSTSTWDKPRDLSTICEFIATGESHVSFLDLFFFLSRIGPPLFSIGPS